MITMIVVIVIIIVLLVLFNKYVAVDATIKQVINIAVILITILWILKTLGIFG